MNNDDFNKYELTPEEFKIFKEAYEKNWENAIKVNEFSFEELEEKGSIKTEIKNFYSDI